MVVPSEINGYLRPIGANLGCGPSHASIRIDLPSAESRSRVAFAHLEIVRDGCAAVGAPIFATDFVPGAQGVAPPPRAVST